jgi:hypothetical protein
MNKFFDICLTGPADIPLGIELRPEQLAINLGTYAGMMRRKLIPVWNVGQYRVKGGDVSMPAVDAINYEYRFDLDTISKDDGFLVDYNNTYILDSRREGRALVITSPKKENVRWNMYRVHRRQDSDVVVYPYPVLSNARKDAFSQRLLLRYGTRIGTRAEMCKLLTSFEAAKYVTLQDVYFTGAKTPGDSYDMNPFIRDEIRDPAFQKTLVLSFRAKQRDSFVNRDIISFLTSALQAVYSEYRCIGILLL